MSESAGSADTVCGLSIVVAVATFGMVSDRRRVDRRPTPPGMLMRAYCYSLGVATRPSATPVLGLEGVHRSVRKVQRSLIL
jgi:hypothetical protein